jgi:hypothetical protein
MEEKIPILRIIFKNMPDLIILQSEYKRFKNLLQLCSEYSISLKDIKRTRNELISPKDFPTTAWEG